MAKYESKKKAIPYAQSVVYAKLSDLRNLEVLKTRLNSDQPDIPDDMKSQVSDDQLSKAKELIQNMEFTADTMSIDIPPVGKLVVEIIEREPEKLVKLTSTQSPIPLTMWIQLVPTSDTSCAMRLTLEAELNMFLKMAVGGKLKEGVDKFADMLAKIPYGE
jgi:hypothetical protein